VSTVSIGHVRTSSSGKTGCAGSTSASTPAGVKRREGGKREMGLAGWMGYQCAVRGVRHWRGRGRGLGHGPCSRSSDFGFPTRNQTSVSRLPRHLFRARDSHQLSAPVPVSRLPSSFRMTAHSPRILPPLLSAYALRLGIAVSLHWHLVLRPGVGVGVTVSSTSASASSYKYIL
jgi:hypothetical protein